MGRIYLHDLDQKFAGESPRLRLIESLWALPAGESGSQLEDLWAKVIQGIESGETRELGGHIQASARKTIRRGYAIYSPIAEVSITGYLQPRFGTRPHNGPSLAVPSIVERSKTGQWSACAEMLEALRAHPKVRALQAQLGAASTVTIDQKRVLNWLEDMKPEQVREVLEYENQLREFFQTYFPFGQPPLLWRILRQTFEMGKLHFQSVLESDPEFQDLRDRGAAMIVGPSPLTQFLDQAIFELEASNSESSPTKVLKHLGISQDGRGVAIAAEESIQAVVAERSWKELLAKVKERKRVGKEKTGGAQSPQSER